MTNEKASVKINQNRRMRFMKHLATSGMQITAGVLDHSQRKIRLRGCMVTNLWFIDMHMWGSSIRNIGIKWRRES